MNSFTRADRTRHRIDLKLRLPLPCPEPAGGHPPGLHAGAQAQALLQVRPGDLPGAGGAHPGAAERDAAGASQDGAVRLTRSRGW